jgi:uncharacterized protein YbjT (DUF2867 family)
MLRARQAVLPARGEGAFTPIYVDDLVDGSAALASPRPRQTFTLTDGGLSLAGSTSGASPSGSASC